MRLIWFPQWACQNYTMGQSFSSRCPYCPYSLDPQKNRLITENRVTESSNSQCPWEDVVEFLLNNAATLDNTVEMSGGEPLLYRDLGLVLNQLIGWKWAITSNTSAKRPLEKLIDALGGWLQGCSSWTASYHPCAGRDEVFAECIRLIRDHTPAHIGSTVVVAPETLPHLARARDFLRSLPIDRVQFHIDSHRNADYAALRQAAIAFDPNIPIYAGNPPTGRFCRVHRDLLALCPDGTLRTCVTKSYLGTGAIGYCKDIRIAELPPETPHCDTKCFACCDWVKHDYVPQEPQVDHDPV